MSKIGGKPTMSKHSWRNLACFQPYPPGHLLWMLLREQYYHVGRYDDQCTRWTTLRQERDQVVSKFTNVFHTLRSKLGIKDFDQNLSLKYCGFMQKYLQKEMVFLDISSLGAAYWYVVKIEKKFKQRNKKSFGYANASQQKMGRGSLNTQTKWPSKDN